MKKAKIMLVVIAIMTIVGSAFALRAHKAFNGNLFCTAIRCAIPPTTVKYITTFGGTVLYCTAIPGVPACQSTTGLTLQP